MKDLLRKYSKFFSVLLGAIYGALIGTVLALLTGNNVLVLAGAYTGFGSWASAVALTRTKALVFTLVCVLVWTGNGAWTWTRSLALTTAGSGALAAAGSGTLHYLAERNKTTSRELIENHTILVFSLLIAMFDWLFRRLASSKHSKTKQSKTKQRAWDMGLIVTFTQELAEVFPEEWDEWQHWISDMMDSRTRMQAKGMNHRLVSLITFYRLVRFALHIGIDKVFILATRRATR